MNHILEIANNYFLQIENPKYWFMCRSMWLVSFSVTFPLFMFLLVYFYPTLNNINYIVLVIVEALAVTSYLFLKEKRDSFLVRKHFGNENKNINDVKIQILNNLLKTTQESYVKKIEYIRQVSVIEEKYKHNVRLSIEYFLSQIYNSNSNSRIIAWLAIVISLLTAIFLSSKENPINIFEIFSQFSISGIFWTNLSLSLFIGFSLMVASIIFNMVGNAMLFFSIALDKERSNNTHAIKLLIRDLIKYAKIPT